jgi:hypothetical protein
MSISPGANCTDVLTVSPAVFPRTVIWLATSQRVPQLDRLRFFPTMKLRTDFAVIGEFSLWENSHPRYDLAGKEIGNECRGNSPSAV